MGFLRAYLKQHRGTACLWQDSVLSFLSFLPSIGFRRERCSTERPLREPRSSGVYCRVSEIPKKMPAASPGRDVSPEGFKAAGAGKFSEEQYQRMIRGLQEACGDLEDGFREKIFGSGGFLYHLDPSDQDAHRGHTAEAVWGGYGTEPGRSRRRFCGLSSTWRWPWRCCGWRGRIQITCCRNMNWIRFCGRRSAGFSTQFIRRRIRLDYKPTEFRVLTDEKWLLFVVEQIISNALKYTKKGGTVTIAMDSPGILSIKDTGHWHRARRICPGSLRKDIRGITGGKIKKPAAWVCIFAGRSAKIWDTGSGRNRIRKAAR